MKGYAANSLTDPVTWELERLDRELNPVTLEEILTASCPLACPALGLIAGLILQQYASLPPAAIWLIVAISAATKIGTATLFPPKQVTVPRFGGAIDRSSLRFYVAVLCCFAVFLAAGALRLDLFRTPPPNDLSRLVGSEPVLATIRGTVASEVRRENRQSWVFGRFQWTEPGCSFLFCVEDVETTAGRQQCYGRIFVHVSGPIKNLPPQSRLQLYCRLSRFQPPSNPGQFDFKRYMEDQGIRISAAVPAAESIEMLPSDRTPALFAALRSRLRLWAQEALEAWGGDQRQYSVLPEALLLGSRRSLDAQTYAAFQKTGLAHYISLSGMHVGILAGFCWLVGRAMGLLKRPRAAFCILLITLYALIVPPRAPTLRAVFLAEFFFFSILLVRRPNSLNTLALTALVMLLVRPADLFSPGWQLSYSSVLGILLLGPRLRQKFTGFLLPLHPFANKVLPPSIAVPALRLTHSFSDLFSVGFGAWLGGAGILLWHFGSFTPFSALWTILVFPLVLLILILGMAKLILVPLLPTLSLLLSILVDRISDLFTAVTVWIADLDLLSFQFGKVCLLLIVGGYLWLIGVFFLPRRLPGRRPIVFGLSGLLIALSLFQFAVLPRFRKELELTFLSVGHGLAVVVECPDGRTLLFDGGSISLKDPGGRVIAPFLRYKGIRRLDEVIVSHGDLDHYNGLPEVLRSIPAQTVRLNPGLIEKAQTSVSAALIRNLIEAECRHVTETSMPEQNLGAVRIVSLWPDEETTARPYISNNDKSEVLLIEYAGRRILLCGDIERSAQESLLSKSPHLHADVLLLPHHGARGNLLPRFVEQLNPSVRVISCPRSRLNGVLPSGPDNQAWLTALHGAVTVKIKADGTIHAAGFLNSQ